MAVPALSAYLTETIDSGCEALAFAAQFCPVLQFFRPEQQATNSKALGATVPHTGMVNTPVLQCLPLPLLYMNIICFVHHFRSSSESSSNVSTY